MPDSEAYVQVAPDQSGKRIRNEQAQIAQPDGTIQTVYTQTVSLADEDRKLLEEMHWTMKRQVSLLFLIWSSVQGRIPTSGGDVADIDEIAQMFN